MKRILTAIMALTAVFAASAQNYPSQRPAERDRLFRSAAVEAKIEQSVQDNLTAKDFTVLIQLMMPPVGASRAVSNYSVQVKGDTLVSYLPYMGQAYNLPYGGGKGLDFTAKIGHYHDQVLQDGNHNVIINLFNGEDVFVYNFNISPSGSAFLTVSSRNRQTISYTGEMYLP